MKGLTQVSPYWGKEVPCSVPCPFSCCSSLPFRLRFQPQQPRVRGFRLELAPVAGPSCSHGLCFAVLGCARPLGQVHKHFPLLDATCSLLDVYYKSMQFHKAPACNKTLLHVWGLKEINGSSLGMHILLRCLLQMKWSWGKTLTSCRVIKGILSFLSDINRKKPLTKSIKFLFPNEFALTIY